MGHTIMTKGHFHFQGTEFFRYAGLCFCAHLLTSPLLDTVKFLVDIHFGRCLEILQGLFLCVFESCEGTCGLLVVVVVV